MLSTAALYRERDIATAIQSTLRHHAITQDAFASLAAVQLVNGILALGATLGLLLYEWWESGPQRLVFLSLLRISALLGVGLVAHKAFGTRVHSFLGLSRPALYRVALYLQLLWFTSELLLGSALLVFFPLLEGSELGSPHPPAYPLCRKFFPVLYMVGMAGCLCFFTQLRSKRRGGKGGKGSVFSPSNSASWLDHSPATSPPRYLECAIMPISTAAGGGAGYGQAAPAAPAATVTCEIVLLEHQLDTNECVLFVHKKLRPIKTRPESPNYLPLLKPIMQLPVTGGTLLQSKGFAIEPQRPPPAAPPMLPAAQGLLLRQLQPAGHAAAPQQVPAVQQQQYQEHHPQQHSGTYQPGQLGRQLSPQLQQLSTSSGRKTSPIERLQQFAASHSSYPSSNASQPSRLAGSMGGSLSISPASQSLSYTSNSCLGESTSCSGGYESGGYSAVQPSGGSSGARSILARQVV